MITASIVARGGSALVAAGSALRAGSNPAWAGGSAWTAARDEPALEGLPDYGTELVRMLISLGAVLGLLFLAAWLLPRWLARGRTATPGRHLEVVETLRLDARRTLYLVRVGAQLVLIGGGEGGLVRLSGATREESEELGAGAFADRLGTATESTARESLPDSIPSGGEPE